MSLPNMTSGQPRLPHPETMSARGTDMERSLPRSVKARNQRNSESKKEKKQEMEKREREKKFKTINADGCGTGHLPEAYINDRPVKDPANPNKEIIPNRHFRRDRYIASAQVKDILVVWGSWSFIACPTSYVKCMACGNPPFHLGCPVVSIASETRGGKGKDKSNNLQSSIGIFYGYENRFNVTSVSKESTNTTEVAILNACLTVLLRFIEIIETANKPKHGNEELFPLHTLVIKSDCEYIIKGVTEWMPKWKDNDWKTCRGNPVANQTLWRMIDMWLTYLEEKISVQFWLVSTLDNAVARYLATTALAPAALPAST